MPRINPSVTDEARKIYDSWGDDKKANTSMAIILFEQLRTGGYVTIEQYNKDIAELKERLEKVEGRK